MNPISIEHRRLKTRAAALVRSGLGVGVSVVAGVLMLGATRTPAQADLRVPPRSSPRIASTVIERTGGGDGAGSDARGARLSSSQYLDATGSTVEQLIATGFDRRADLLAARQRFSIAAGRVTQAGLRPNPTLDTEYGSPRFLAGEAEQDLSIGVSQIFETGGKRGKRVAVARLELAQARAEVAALERAFAADVRTSYARALGFSRQLDRLEHLVGTNEELARVTRARLTEGDVAPLDLNLVRVETDRLRAQAIRTRADLEGELISLRSLVGFDVAEPLRLAPAPERPPRLDLTLAELTDLALRERADLQAARLGEELGAARIRLAESLAAPNVAASIRFSRSRELFDLPARLGGGALSDTDNGLTFGVSIELPVFNRNQGEIISAAGERTQAARGREFLEATVRRDVALAYRRYRAAAEAYVLYSTQIVPRSADNLRSVRAAYDLGEYSTFDVVNEQRRLIESELGAGEAIRDYYAALAELERAVGGELPASGFAPAPVSLLPDLNRIAPEATPAAMSAPISAATERAAPLHRSLESAMSPGNSAAGASASEPRGNDVTRSLNKEKP